jgi:FG-GAP-like repeat/PASTA domain
LNRDHLPDVVTANAAGGSVSVLLQDGSGVFAPKRDYGTNAEPSGVAIGDLNGDGAPDLAVTDMSDSVSVLLNDGSGGFGATHAYPVGSAPAGVAIADLNADGKPDVEVANSDDGSVSVLLNKGGGELDSKRDYKASDGASFLAIADMNADGKLDIATSNNSDGTASVLIAKPGACDVQAVTGKTLRAARSTLSRFNCRVKVRRRYSRSVRRGLVISQKPGFGAVLSGGGKVKLVVSKGRKR